MERYRKLRVSTILIGLGLGVMLLGGISLRSGLMRASRRSQDPINLFANPYSNLPIEYGTVKLAHLPSQSVILNAEVMSDTDGSALVAASVPGTVYELRTKVGSLVEEKAAVAVLLSPEGLRERNQTVALKAEENAAQSDYERKKRAFDSVRSLKERLTAQLRDAEGAKSVQPGEAATEQAMLEAEISRFELVKLSPQALDEIEKGFTDQTGLSAYRLEIFEPLYDYRRQSNYLQKQWYLARQGVVSRATVTKLAYDVRNARLKASSAIDNGLRRAQQELEKATAALAAAEAARRSAEERVLLLGGSLKQNDPADQFTMRAPMSGRISEVMVMKGSVVDAGQPIARIIDPTKLRVEAWLPREAEAALRGGGPIEGKLRMYFLVRGWKSLSPKELLQHIPEARDKARELVVLSLSPGVESETGRRRLLASQSAAGESIVPLGFSPGERITVLVDTSQTTPVFLVSPSAIAKGSDGSSIVYRRPADDVPETLPLPPSRERVENPFPSIRIRLLDGMAVSKEYVAIAPLDPATLKAGDEIVTSGALNIRETETLDIANQRVTGGHSH